MPCTFGVHVSNRFDISKGEGETTYRCRGRLCRIRRVLPQLALNLAICPGRRLGVLSGSPGESAKGAAGRVPGDHLCGVG